MTDDIKLDDLDKSPHISHNGDHFQRELAVLTNSYEDSVRDITAHVDNLEKALEDVSSSVTQATVTVAKVTENFDLIMEVLRDHSEYIDSLYSALRVVKEMHRKDVLRLTKWLAALGTISITAVGMCIYLLSVV